MGAIPGLERYALEQICLKRARGDREWHRLWAEAERAEADLRVDVQAMATSRIEQEIADLAERFGLDPDGEIVDEIVARVFGILGRRHEANLAGAARGGRTRRGRPGS